MEAYGDVIHKMQKVKQREVSLFTRKREVQGRGGGLISIVYRKWSQILLRCAVKGQGAMDTTLMAVRQIPVRYKEKKSSQ